MEGKKWIIVFSVLIDFVLLVIVGYYVSNSRDFQFFGTLISRVETEEKVIALTIDDGPSPYADTLLEMFWEMDIKATFFVVGLDLERYPDWGKRAVALGHELGNHSYSHPRFIFKTTEFIDSEISRTDQLIREAGHKGEIYFRAPGCKKLLILPYYLEQNKRISVTWDLEPDSLTELANHAINMTNYVLENVRAGSILLFHLMFPQNEESVKAVRHLVPELKKAGYRFVTLSELLKYRRTEDGI